MAASKVFMMARFTNGVASQDRRGAGDCWNRGTRNEALSAFKTTGTAIEGRSGPSSVAEG